MTSALSRLDRTAWIALGLAFALGLPGAWPRAGTGPDPLALLAWIALVAPAAGYLAGAGGVRLFPVGVLVPALWMILFVEVDLASDRDIPQPMAAGLVALGLFLVGLGWGGCRRGADHEGRAGGPGAARLLLCTSALASLGVLTGWLTGEGGFAAAYPEAQALLLELSPLAFAFDAGGWDWAHANPATYRLGGVEWVARSPWSGGLAGATAVVVGCVLAFVLPRLGRTSPSPTGP